MINSLLNIFVTVERRTSQGRDSINNPIFGDPVSGSGWAIEYSNVPVRLAFSSKALQFAMTGERPTPAGIMYVNPSYVILAEDRIITPDNIQYVVTSVVPGYLNGQVIDHYECILGLP